MKYTYERGDRVLAQDREQHRHGDERQRDRDQRRSDRDDRRALGPAFKHQLHVSPLARRSRRAAFAPPISKSELLARRLGRVERRRQPAVEHHRDAVGDLGKFVEILADDQHRACRGAARSISAWRMVAAAPASTPQVGWLTTSTPGSRRISRPTMNFCKLPPERLTASGSRLALRTSKVLVVRSTCASVAGLSMKPVLTMPLAAWPVSNAFSDSFMRGAVPWPSRSSGTKAAPMRRRSVTPSRPAALPSMTIGAFARRQALARQRRKQFVLTVAGDAGDADDLAAAHLERHLLRAACRADRPAASDSLWMTSRGTDALRPDAAFTSPISAPTIMRASDAAVSWRGSQVATFLPPRRIVAVSQSRFTSSSLWLM